MKQHGQFLLNMLAKFMGFAISFGISFFLTPFIVKSVGSEAYGFVGLANNFVGYAQLITIALNSMARRYIAISIHQHKELEANKYFSSIVFSNIIIASALGVLFSFIVIYLNKVVNISADIFKDVQLLWIFVFLQFLIGIVFSAYDIANFVRNKLYLSSVQGTIAYLLQALLLLVAFSFFTPSIWYIGLASLLYTTYYTVWSVINTRRLMPEVTVKGRYFDIHLVKTLVTSGVWNSFSKLSSILSTGLDLLVTNLFVGSVQMGIMSLSKTVPNAILSLIGTLANVFYPQLAISYAKNDFEGMKKQIIFSIKFLGMISCIPLAIMFTFGENFYRLWVPTQDSHLLNILSILACLEFIFTLPLEGMWYLYTVANKVKQTSIFIFFNSLLTIIVEFAALYFVKDTTMRLYIIAGVSTVFAIIKALTFMPIFGAKCLNLPLGEFYPPILKSSLSVLIVTVIAFSLKRFLLINSWFHLIACSLVITFAALAINSFVMLNKAERKLIYSSVAGFLKHKSV